MRPPATLAGLLSPKQIGKARVNSIMAEQPKLLDLNVFSDLRILKRHMI